MCVYVNGKLDGKKKVATPGLAIFDSPNARTVIGRAAGKNRDSWRDTYFPGPIDEIKIWKRALRPAEVKLLYAQTLAKGKSAPAALCDCRPGAVRVRRHEQPLRK